MTSPPRTATTAAPARQKVAITGAAGFLGRHLVSAYLTKGAHVRAIVRPGSVHHRWEASGALEVVERDLLRDDELSTAFQGRSLVIHAAAIVRHPPGASGRAQVLTNVDMTRLVVEACRASGVARMVHVSSTAAIGVSTDPQCPANEGFEYNLGHLGLAYNDSKHRAERVVLDASTSECTTVVANPAFVFGPNADRYAGAEVIARVLARRQVVCTGGGLSMVHLDDVVHGIMLVADRGRRGERYILTGENHTFESIARVVARSAGVHRRTIRVPDLLRNVMGGALNAAARARGGGPNLALTRRYAYQFYSSAKARTELGFSPRGFEAIVADYLRFVGEQRSAPTDPLLGSTSAHL